MKRLIDFARGIHAVPAVAFALTAFLLASSAAGQTNYCNNPVPPCDPDNPVTLCYLPPTPPPLCEPLQCGKCTKSPCYVASGGYVYEEVDLAIRTTGFPIGVARTYHSTNTIDGLTGYGWTSSLSAKLYYTAFLKAAPDIYEREAHVRLPNGSMYRFVDNGDDTYRPPPGRFDTLVRQADGTWDLHLQGSRAVLRFSATGNLLTMSDEYGNTQVWTYVNDRLQRIEDASGSGRFIDISYGADGRISDVTDLTGRNIRYTYDSRGVMISMTNPANHTTAFSYAMGKYVPLLNAVNDHWGRAVTMVSYDAQDRVRSYSDAGETYTYTYAYGGVRTTTAKTDSSGNRWLYSFDANGLVTESRAPDGSAPPRVTYDANGALITEIDPVGVKTTYTHDSRGNWLTTTWDAAGPAAVQWRVVYDQQFPEQPASLKAYDPATNQIHPHWQGTQVTYHAPGSAAPGAVDKMYALDSDGTTARLTAAFTYDEQGRVLRVTDGSGAVTNFGYDVFGNRVAAETPANNTSGLRPVTRLTYDSLGRTTAVTDAEGNVTTYVWDVLDRLRTITFPPPSASSSLTFMAVYEYDVYDATKRLLFTRVTGTGGGVVQYGRDEFGRETERIDQAGNITRTIYGRGLPEAIIDANGYRTSYTWDVKRRLSAITFPDGTSKRYTYGADDTVATITNRANEVTSYAYDGLKRVVRESVSTGGAIAYTDEGEKLVRVVDTRVSPSDTFDYAWDSGFRLISESQGGRGTVAYAYTPEGRLGVVSVAGGASTSYSYYPDGTVQGMSWSPVQGTFDFEYQPSGLRSSIRFPNGQIRSYSYDALGRLTQIANTHPQAGLLAAFDYGYDVDANTGQPTMTGLRTSITANVPAGGLSQAMTKLSYDNRAHLVRAEYPAAVPYGGSIASWAYDRAGHRSGAATNGVSVAYTYGMFGGNALNSPRLTSDGTNSYSYDVEGNVTSRSGSRGQYTFGWNTDNLLEDVSGDVTATYGYDFGRRRTSTAVNGSSTTFLYDGPHISVESGPTKAEFIYAPGIDEPLAMLRAGEIYYYSVDGLGSIISVTDSAGTLQNLYAWDVWGSALLRQEAVRSPFGYTGRDMAEAGMHYYRRRSYDPAVGRFASEDPLQDLVPVDGSDLYSYAGNSPAMYGDPFGLLPALRPCGPDYLPDLPPGCPPYSMWPLIGIGSVPQRCKDAVANAPRDPLKNRPKTDEECGAQGGCIGPVPPDLQEIWDWRYIHLPHPIEAPVPKTFQEEMAEEWASGNKGYGSDPYKTKKNDERRRNKDLERVHQRELRRAAEQQRRGTRLGRR